MTTSTDYIERVLRSHRRYAGIGSRDTPESVLQIMQRIGKRLCDSGWHGLSGYAKGADRAFHTGARLSTRYREVGFTSIIPWNGFKSSKDDQRAWVNSDDGIVLSEWFNTTQAQALAFEARGSFNGLSAGGIALHTRNPFQVLTPTLNHPVDRVICYARPVGTSGAVNGGTNTAVQIALRHGVPVLNLYLTDVYAKFERWLNASQETRPTA